MSSVKTICIAKLGLGRTWSSSLCVVALHPCGFFCCCEQRLGLAQALLHHGSYTSARVLRLDKPLNLIASFHY